jgi:secreted trypsin-like serine protease
MMRTHKGLSALAVVIVLSLSCTQELEGGDQATLEDELVGGDDSRDRAVVTVVVFRGTDGTYNSCTAELISPSVVLTAAHCFDPIEGLGPPERAAVILGPNYKTSQQGVAAASWHLHPKWRNGGTSLGNDAFYFGFDVAVVELAEPVGIRPLRIRCEPLGTWIVERNVRLVGTGRTDPSDPASDGPRRKAVRRVDALTPQHLLVVDQEHIFCNGDSGGPLIRDDRILAVNSFALIGGQCVGSAAQRIDTVADFIEERVRELDPTAPSPCR